MVKVALGLEVQSQAGASLRDRGESVAECQLPMASLRPRVQPAARRTACVARVSGSGVQTTSAAAEFAAAAAVDQSDCDPASVELRHRAA